MRARIEQVARDVGADDVGVAPAHRLGGEPSMDTDYLLPGTRSVISVMVAFDPDIVRQYLAKEDREAMHRHETECYRRLDRVAHSVARVLEEAGHRTAVTEPNLDYRYKSKPAYRHIPPAIRQAAVDWMARDGSAPVRAARRSVVRRVPAAFLGAGNFRLTPTFAHRYGAVAAGIGSLGWSGNVLHPDHGARVLYHSVLTDAELPPDDMRARTTCDGCRLCTRVCQGGYMHPKESDGVDIGGVHHAHTRKAANLRCILVCGGLTGQSRDARWSTWSPGRIRLPATDEELPRLWERVARASLGRDNHYSRTLAALQYHADHGFVRKTEDRFVLSCAYCQMVCAPSIEQRKELYRTIVESGCVEAEPAQC